MLRENELLQKLSASNHEKDFVEVAEKLNFGEFHFKRDENTGLFAIVAIHSTVRGPSLGGCRCVPYASPNSAFVDALRLAHGMSYKAAISNLPLGGGKAVIIRPSEINDRKAFFGAFGDFVHSLNGKYITAEDSGTTVDDMDTIRKKTPYVVGYHNPRYQHHDPSPLTAFGVRRGIEAAVKFQLGKESVEGLHIAIQGVGNVGYHLAKELHQLGARLTVSDITDVARERCATDFGANIVSPEDIHKTRCDVYAPCALSNAVSKTTIDEINTTIIAGAANNQLASLKWGDTLHDRGILYAPDFAINAGGLIHVAAQYAEHSEEKAREDISRIYDTLMEIFGRSERESRPTYQVAYEIAEERLQNPKT